MAAAPKWKEFAQNRGDTRAYADAYRLDTNSTAVTKGLAEGYYNFKAGAGGFARPTGGVSAGRGTGSARGPSGRGTGTPASATWTRPRGWRLPKNGSWSGTPGHSDFIPSNPQALGVPVGTSIPFRNGYPNLSQWQRGTPLDVPGLNGNYGNDMPLIYQEVARLQGLPNQTAGQSWLSQQGLSPHHAGGNIVQLIPTPLHGGLRHMGGAWELRNQ
jgi:hypothetical protein